MTEAEQKIEYLYTVVHDLLNRDRSTAARNLAAEVAELARRYEEANKPPRHPVLRTGVRQET